MIKHDFITIEEAMQCWVGWFSENLDEVAEQIYNDLQGEE